MAYKVLTDPQQLRKRKRYFQRRYREQREWAIEFLGGKCASCGSKKRLQFDHSNARLKKHSVSVVLRGWSRERLIAFFKAEHIQVLCENCHRAKTELDKPS
jgi:5-methylcytosine-specific restriction endonuclease McrA